SWIRGMWYVPQASSFCHRDVFEEFGLLREDLNCVFDTAFGLRIALGKVFPKTLTRPLAVRYLHDDAKSADPAGVLAACRPRADRPHAGRARASAPLRPRAAPGTRRDPAPAARIGGRRAGRPADPAAPADPRLLPPPSSARRSLASGPSTHRRAAARARGRRP